MLTAATFVTLNDEVNNSLFKSYSFVKVIYLLIRCYNTKTSSSCEAQKSDNPLPPLKNTTWKKPDAQSLQFYY